MGTKKVMVIRHAEKPGKYARDEYATGNFKGIKAKGKKCKESLVTLGWERAGGLSTLFAPPWGPRKHLATPKHLFASDPFEKASEKSTSKHDDGPSRRPFETLTNVAGVLGLKIHHKYAKGDYEKMIDKALAYDDDVLIAWQHQDIPSISQYILEATGTKKTFDIPDKWDGSRYDLVWVLDRDDDTKEITDFRQVAQMLLAGDEEKPIKSCQAAVGA